MEEPKRLLTQAERWVMWLAVDTVVLFAGAIAMLHWGTYMGGYTCGESLLEWLAVLMIPTGLLLFVIMTIWVLMAALCHRRVIIQVSICQLLVWMLVALVLFVRPDPPLFLRGFQDRVTEVASLDQLRRIRQEIVSTRPPNEDFDHHEVTREELSAPVKDSPSDEWSLGSIQPEFDKRWKDICERTEIEKLIGKQRVYLESDGDHATLTWGGALPGHWGIEMGIGKIEVPDSRLSQIRLADDIYLFHGD